MDRRLFRSNGHVACVSLRGKAKAERFVEAQPFRVAAVVADLLSAPKGGRDRQLVRGETFMVLDTAEGNAFGYAEKDGYVGWINASELVGGGATVPTHRISAARSYGKTTPGLKAMGRITPLPFGARLGVIDDSDGWSRVEWGRGTIPRDLFVPSRHLAPLDMAEKDPVAIADLFLGTPYLWGGNSSFGIDCSGLVQAGCDACGIPCPGDSDMQQAALGETLAPGIPPERGDLFFWKGHVAWVADAQTLIHANAFHMAVAYEPIAAALARIQSQGDGAVTRHARLASLV